MAHAAWGTVPPCHPVGGACPHGLSTYALGLAVGSRALFLGRGSRLWRVPGVQLPQPAASLAAMGKDEARLFADTAARVLAEAMTPRPEMDLTDEAHRRYRDITRALVNKRQALTMKVNLVSSSQAAMAVLVSDLTELEAEAHAERIKAELGRASEFAAAAWAQVGGGLRAPRAGGSGSSRGI